MEAEQATRWSVISSLARRLPGAESTLLSHQPPALVYEHERFQPTTKGSVSIARFESSGGVWMAREQATLLVPPTRKLEPTIRAHLYAHLSHPTGTQMDHFRWPIGGVHL